MRIGIDLGGTKIEAIALADDGTIRARRRIPSPRGNYRTTLDTIRDLVRAVESDAGTACPVGVGIPGTISPATGLIKNAPNADWLIGHPLDTDLAAALG